MKIKYFYRVKGYLTLEGFKTIYKPFRMLASLTLISEKHFLLISQKCLKVKYVKCSSLLFCKFSKNV